MRRGHDDHLREDPARHLNELSSLYEVARVLVGARDHGQVALRGVFSGMTVLGVGSGTLFIDDERNRCRLLYSSLQEHAPGETVVVPEAAREWMLRQGAFRFGAPSARALGHLHDRLAERHDAATGVAFVDPEGFLGFVVFGPRIFPGEIPEETLALLDSIGTMIGQALASRPERAAPPPRRTRVSRSARGMDALRAAHPPLASMIGSSPSLLEACQDLLAVAPTPFPALLAGESGVGKELAARAIHDLSDRAERPFEVVDCGSIPRELIESELFGHVRGAFTNAHRDRRGSFEMAHRGTIFLDEIGEMPLELQPRLLRVLQEGRFRRVGDERVIDVDVRVIAATHRDLKAEVAARRFREDLYHRLNVFAVRIPPLRERVQDFEPLVRHFLSKQAAALGLEPWDVSRETLRALETYAWPGNVRELANFCASLAVRSRERSEITLEDLDHVWRRQHREDPPWRLGSGSSRGRVGEWVLDHLRASRFNLVEAARVLKRRIRSGQRVPVSERSALAYYLTGEILRALVEHDGDQLAAAEAVAGDPEMAGRVRGRVAKVCEALHAARGRYEALAGRFAKLPAGYEETLERAARLT
jgi:transcriptional regulator with GAF, ATPase, and Fis domain